MNYAQPGLGAESREFYVPPTTHFIATVEDLIDMLDYDFENIDGMATMPEKRRPKTRRLPDARRPPLRMTCTWWIHPKKLTAMTKKPQSRINLPRYS